MPQDGFQGDIQYQGDPNGILPLDRPNQFKLFGNYLLGNLNLGLGINGSSGAPLDPAGAEPGSTATAAKSRRPRAARAFRR